MCGKYVRALKSIDIVYCTFKGPLLLKLTRPFLTHKILGYHTLLKQGTTNDLVPNHSRIVFS